MPAIRIGRRIRWPLSIDLSIAVSTFAVLALTGAPRRAADASPVHNDALLHPLDMFSRSRTWC